MELAQSQRVAGHRHRTQAHRRGGGGVAASVECSRPKPTLAAVARRTRAGMPAGCPAVFDSGMDYLHRMRPARQICRSTGPGPRLLLSSLWLVDDPVGVEGLRFHAATPDVISPLRHLLRFRRAVFDAEWREPQQRADLDRIAILEHVPARLRQIQLDAVRLARGQSDHVGGRALYRIACPRCGRMLIHRHPIRRHQMESAMVAEIDHCQRRTGRTVVLLRT